jgi:hypothetical protein
MTADTDGTLEVTVPVRAGSRLVGATFLATNYRPSLDIIRQYDRKSLENNTIPQLQYYPAIGFVRIRGPFHAQRPSDSASRRKVFTCRPGAPVQEAAPASADASARSRRSGPVPPASEVGCAREILTALARRAYRRPPTEAEIASLLAFFEDGRRDATFDDGIELGLRRLLASPQFLVRAEREPAAVRATKKTRRLARSLERLPRALQTCRSADRTGPPEARDARTVPPPNARARRSERGHRWERSR